MLGFRGLAIGRAGFARGLSVGLDNPRDPPVPALNLLQRGGEDVRKRQPPAARDFIVARAGAASPGGGDTSLNCAIDATGASCLVAFVSSNTGGGVAVGSCTFDGAAMTEVAAVDNGGPDQGARAYVLANPSQGAFNVAISGCTPGSHTIVALAARNVDVSGTPYRTPSALEGGPTPSLTLSAQVGDLVLGFSNYWENGGAPASSALEWTPEVSQVNSGGNMLARAFSRGGHPDARLTLALAGSIYAAETIGFALKMNPAPKPARARANAAS